MSQEDYALLLQDVEGFKKESQQLKPVTVKKSSLLIHLNPSVVNGMKKNYECVVNYQVDHLEKALREDSSVKNTELVYVDSNVLFYLSKRQRDLLLGVKNPYNRLEVLGRLEWVESLRKGSKVYVTIPTITAPVRGIVRYIGSLPGEEGRKFGVELMGENRGQGTHDGRFNETKFFKCAKNCAVFVAMDKLIDRDTVEVASMLKDSHGNPIRLGDIVTFYDEFNMKPKGIVRWIGINRSLLPEGTPIVGIEVETHINWSDVPHHVNIKDHFIRDYFSSEKSKVFLPITFVKKDENSKCMEGPAHADSSGFLPGGVKTAHLQSKNKVPSRHGDLYQFELPSLAIPESYNPYNLGVGSAVQYFDQYGVIKWIGTILGSKVIHAGVEMEDDVSESGSNGELMGVKYFNCKPGKGKFAHLTSLKPDERNKKLSDSKANKPIYSIDVSVEPDEAVSTHNLMVGSRIKYIRRGGVIKWIGNLSDLGSEVYAGIEMEEDVHNPQDGSWYGEQIFKPQPGRGKLVPLSALQPDDQCVEKPQSNNASSVKHGVFKFEKMDMVQFSNPPQYGIIKWIGNLPGQDAKYAGVETEDYFYDYTDGKWKGIPYFHPPSGRGKFIPLSELQPDERFTDQAAQMNHSDSSGINTVVIHQDPTTSGSNIEQSKSDHGNESTDVSFTAEKVHQNVEQKIYAVEAQMKSYIKKSEESIQRMEANVDNAFQTALEVQSINKKLQVNNTDIQSQLSLTQQQLLNMQKNNEHLQSQILTILDKLSHKLSHTQQQLLDMQRSNEQLQKANSHLQNQLSLTQQQLLGVQSMVTSSRLWVVSHDQFTIGREIGRGAWASVHETTFRGARVAAKRLHDEITSPETIELFHQEMEMALGCQHQNIITFLGVTLENHPVILMELMDINLRSAYKRGSIKYQQVPKIFCDIASALHFLHTRPDPLIHRDVSSANVLLKDCGNEKWLAKLGDFGTAKLQQYCTTPGPGALAYAAPEVADPKDHSTKMDVYSFGVLVIEVLTKTLPFQNLNTLKGQVQQQFPQYHQLVTSCTNQQSSDRPTMYDVIGQLNKIL